MKNTESLSSGIQRKSPHEERAQWLKADRRKIRALLRQRFKSAEWDDGDTDEITEDIADQISNHINTSPPFSVDHSEKRGRGKAYDRMRSAKWNKSARAAQRREGKWPMPMDAENNLSLPQARRHIFKYQGSIRKIFSGHALPTRRARAEKRLKKTIEKDKLTKRKTESTTREIEALWDGLEPYQRYVYGVYKSTREKITGIRKRSDKERAAKNLLMKQRHLWRRAHKRVMKSEPPIR